MDLQKAVAAFNVSLFEFALELRIGYNVGDVTSGVIGTTKLYFDIWGDTVNTASRMDSTGAPGRIQTTQRCALLLAPRFDFERRGEVFVKGKDHMVTYYLKGPRAGATPPSAKAPCRPRPRRPLAPPGAVSVMFLLLRFSPYRQPVRLPRVAGDSVCIGGPSAAGPVASGEPPAAETDTIYTDGRRPELTDCRRVCKYGMHVVCMVISHHAWRR